MCIVVCHIYDICLYTVYTYIYLYHSYYICIYIYTIHVCVWLHIENLGFLNHPFLENLNKRAHGLVIFHVEIATASPPIFRQALIYKIVGYITIRSHKIFELYPNDISL